MNATTPFVVAGPAGELRQICSASRPREWIAEHWVKRPDEKIVFVDALPPLPLTNWRVVNGAVVERAAIAAVVSGETIAADGIAECLITGLPNPCSVTIAGAAEVAPAEVAGGTLALTSTQPGAITIRVTADPTHKPWETVIHAA